MCAHVVSRAAASKRVVCFLFFQKAVCVPYILLRTAVTQYILIPDEVDEGGERSDSAS